MFKIGCSHRLSISNNGNNTKFLLCISLCGKFINLFKVIPLKSIISISHVLGEFFLSFFLPSLISINLQILSKSMGFRLHDAFNTIFKNFGFLGSGQDGVS